MNSIDTDILNALHDKFYRAERVKIPEDCGIITACNPNHFGLFQLLYYSLYLSSNAVITVYDLWLTPEQKKWCSKQDRLKVECLTEDELIFPIMKDKTYWPTWNKPLYFLRSPHKKNLWIDADCVVFGNINELLDKINIGPVIFACEFGCQDKDISKLHRALKTHIIPHQSSPPCLNAGVLGFDKDRDLCILEKWIEAISAAVSDPAIQKITPWYDQGGLQWTMEVLNKLDLISQDTTWNHDKIKLPDDYSTVLSFIQGLKETECKLAHFAGTAKRKINWEALPINLNPLKLYHDFYPVYSRNGVVSAAFRFEEDAIDYTKFHPVYSNDGKMKATFRTEEDAIEYAKLKHGVRRPN